MIVRTGFLFIIFSMYAFAQVADSTQPHHGNASTSPLPVLIPLSRYVDCGPIKGGSKKSPVSITIEEALQLTVIFNRDSLPKDCGIQFLTVTISIFNKHGVLTDKIVKQAFTFPREDGKEADRSKLHFYAGRVAPYGFVSEQKIERVKILHDSIPQWSLMKVELTPTDEYTKFAERLKYEMEWWYRIKGSVYEGEFFLGIPKVLYDSRSDDPIVYGNASAMMRLYLLHSETGDRYPVNVGIGTFGVSTPIDVSKNGGGIAISLLFDIVQAVRLSYDMDIPNKLNAGIEITPFFPLERKSRILVNARIGYSP
jgi:hypothetical protein